jgi:hypothetical protein
LAGKGKLVAVAGIAIAAGAGALLLIPKVSANTGLAKLVLSLSSTSVSPGQDIDATVVAYDASGAPLAGVVAKLMANGANEGSFPATDSTGTATLTFTFTQSGSFAVEAQG